MELKVCADHVDLLMARNRKQSKVLFETEHSIVILDENMPCLFVSCTDLSESDELIQSIKPYQNLTIALHQKELVSCFASHDVYLECINLFYDKKLPDLLESPYLIRMLNLSDVRQASQLYRKMDFNEYVKHCIEKEVCYGMFDGKKLIAMIGEHDEEMIGLLEVHPDYRRKHLALILEIYMMHVQQAKGRMIAAQIQLGNEVSFLLHEKLGFERGTETVAWMRHRKRSV